MSNSSPLLGALRHFLGEETLLLLDDQRVSEIYTNDDLRIRTDGAGGRQLHPGSYDPARLSAFLQQIAVGAGRPLDENHPIGDFELPVELGSGRLHVKLPPVTRQPNFNIRKPPTRLFLLPELVELGALPPEAVPFLTEQLSQHLTFLVAGPTNSGKTNFLNALLYTAVEVNDPSTRFLVIEDVPELRCPAPDTQYSRTTQSVTLWDLVRATMRSSPDLIVVGEIRGTEAFPFLDLASSGHRGVLATIHAETPLGALHRLNRLARRSNPDIPDQYDLIAEEVDLVVCLTGGSKGRRVTAIQTIDGWSADQGFALSTPPALAGSF
jgi:Flp pilus assembly CpaF family ATPase